jgi:hypothetical protein
MKKSITNKNILPIHLFVRRVIKYFFIAASIGAASLLIGIFGYHWLGHLSWVDSLLNASMILGGMGPVDALHDADAKIFASFYALFSGVIFLTTVAIFLSPIAHRLLHILHVVDEEDQ